jgi:hypothetical protein
MPIYDYGMVDDDFMLAPLAARWLLDGTGSRARANAFLASESAPGTRAGQALVRNFMWVVERTAAFASDPAPTNLVSIKPGRRTGQWRDSEEGLGRGLFPYDINVALVPAALDAIDRLLQSGLLDPHVTPEQRWALARARAQRQIWSTRAAPFFVTTVPADRARAAISSYASGAGVPARPALDSLKAEALSFNAVSLDSKGAPVPVMHSDDGFTLLFGEPAPADIERTIETLTRPYPAGLLTPVGMLVANPVFATPDVQARFTNTAYHGTVVWSWQQAVMAAGLDRQLARNDLPHGLRTRVEAARDQLWKVIDATRELRASELWTWSFENGRYRAEAFGQRRADVDESNAAQLWSTVYLALPRPAR